jgi:DNA polymerase-4
MGRELLDGVLPLRQPVRLMGLTLSALEGSGAPAATDPSPGQGTLPF